MNLFRSVIKVIGLCACCGVASCAATGSGGAFLGTSGGAPWTIRCMEFQGPQGTVQAERVAESLRQTPGIRAEDVFVREESDGYSRLYYGTYFRRRGASELPRQLRADLDLLRDLGDSSGRPLFLQALPVRKPQPDVGRPAWNLANVNAVYSLQVAAFEPTDTFWEFKRAAAEYCELLRSKGYEAYYHHGVSTSVVTVGRFGPEAVTRDALGRTYYSQEVQRLQQDELLKYNFLNGGIVKVKSDTGEMIPVPSRLVEVPRSPGTGGR